MSLVSAGNSKQCSCGSNSTYLQCCGQFIDGLSLPITPEALMRSRYTAYTLADIAYIKKTMRGKATIGFDETEAGHWASSVYWLGITVLQSRPHATDTSNGHVEFIAKYLDKNTIRTIHEISEFHQIDGIWFYIDGRQMAEPPLPVGRNAVCPCKSQKKFKNCHGKDL